MGKKLELLSLPTNFAVIQLPERKYPGVVIQGDTLFSLVNDLTNMIALVEANDSAELLFALRDTREQLQGALVSYEAACLEHEIELPYPKARIE